ncbi:MAG: Grx4 family monothiol glutaredoxin [Gammaproteobacteria bacterium]
MKTEDKIRQQLSENPIILYMKGIPKEPECGFSAKAVQVLNATNVPYAYVNVLSAPFIREKLPKISRWPTFPQLFVKGELIGGSDIIEQMFNDGSLQPLLASATDSAADSSDGHLSAAEIEQLIKQAIADAEIRVDGAGCDLTVTVVSTMFAGMTPVKKQQAVLAPLTEAINSGKLHSVTVKTYTPEEWEQTQSSQPGLLQIQL